MKVIENKVISTGYLKVEELKVQSGDKIVSRERINHADAVAAVVFNTETKKYLFVKQFRPGPEKVMLEIVAGKVDKGETPYHAIGREIEEELGYAVDAVKLLKEYYPTVGYSTEKITVYFCEVSEKVSNGGGIDDEEIEIVEMSETEFYNYDFEDGKSLIGQLIHFNS